MSESRIRPNVFCLGVEAYKPGSQVLEHFVIIAALVNTEDWTSFVHEPHELENRVTIVNTLHQKQAFVFRFAVAFFLLGHDSANFLGFSHCGGNVDQRKIRSEDILALSFKSIDHCIVAS